MGLAADAVGVWVACWRAPALLRIDPQTNQVTARVAVGHDSRRVGLGPDAVWVASNAENTLMRTDPGLNRVVALYQVGQEPFGVAAAGNQVWVVMSGEASVWRIRPSPCPGLVHGSHVPLPE